MDVIARFDRSPQEEIRACLVTRAGQQFLELRVFRKAAPGEPEPSPSLEGISLPLGQFADFSLAIRAVEEALRQGNLLARPSPAQAPKLNGTPPPIPGPRPCVSPLARWAGRHQGRRAGRIPLDCPVEYVVRRPSDRLPEADHRRGRTRDINHGGAQLVLQERISLLTQLTVTLHLPVGVISLPCEVVWAQLSGSTVMAGRECRHGVRFTAVGPEEGRVLDRLLEHAAQ